MTQIYDLSDPAKPVFIRNFGLPGQQPGSTGPVPTELHGAISTGTKGNRVYFGYGTGANGIVQIVDREKLLKGPKEPTDANLIYPQVARLDLPPDVGAHTVFPMLGHAGRPSSAGRSFVPAPRRPPASSTTTTKPRRTARRRGAISSPRSARRPPTNVSRTGRCCGCSTSRPSRNRSACRRGRCPSRAAISASVADASARTPRTRT